MRASITCRSGRADLDEGPTAQRMADSIGAVTHMVTPTEDDLVRYFDQSVYHAEQPVFTLHGSGKIILSEFVREQGYKVRISLPNSDALTKFISGGIDW